jgi:hypothetical protein
MILSLGNSSNAQRENSVQLETIGELTAKSLYMTYSCIDTLADGYENDVYEKEQALKILAEYLALTKYASKQLDKLAKESTISSSEIKFLEEIEMI